MEDEMTAYRNEQQARDAMESAQRDLDNLGFQTRNALDGHRKAVRAALRDPMVPDGGKVYRVGELRTQATDKLREIDEKIRQAQAKAKGAAEYLTRDTRSATEQTRDDQRVQMAWNRARMMLDAGVSAHEVVSRAAEQGDRATVEAMHYFAPTHLEASIHARGGNVGDYQHQTGALQDALKSAKAATAHPAQTVLADLSETAEALGTVTARAREEVAGGDPIAALHVELADGVGDFSGTIATARENAALLSRLGGETAIGRAS
jgi:hypothetical protein